MKQFFRTQLLGLLCLALILTAGCNAGITKNILEQDQEAYTFITEDVQPIEAISFKIPKEIPLSVGLHRLDVQRPKMDAITNSDEVVNAILSSANQVANINSKDLASNVHLETGDRPVTKSLSDENGYLRVFIQRESSEQDNIEQEGGEDLWGEIHLDAIADHFFGADSMQDSSNCAIVIKYRNNGENGGNNFGFSNSNISTGIHVDNYGGLHFWSNDDQNHYGYEIEDTRKEYLNILQPTKNEWYYALVAMDANLGYRFITWQENNPVNHAYFAIDLNGIFFADDEIQGQHIWANMNFFTQANEVSLDIESIGVYTFDQFHDVENIVQQYEPATFTYSNNEEKFQFAVQLFENEDYYNAYRLLEELDGYESSATYLAECERLLKTFYVENRLAAGKIKKAMKESGMPITEYLYVYQAEKLKSLDLSECLIDDLLFITHFTHLKELNLDKNGISDLIPLKDLYALEWLSLAKNNISDTLPLSNLSNLQYLNLRENLLEDVSNLNNIPSLVELDLSFNKIHTVMGLNNLSNMESIDLSFNFITSLGALSQSPIKKLNIMNTDINNLGAVANFDQLEELSAGFRYIWLGNKHYLITRNYEIPVHFFNGLDGLETLSGHQNLKSLYVGRLNAGTLQPLATMPNLERLMFHQYSGPTELEILGSLVSLKELRLDTFWGGFDDFSFLPNLTNLEKLEIGGCSTDDPSAISGLSNLQELRIPQYGNDLSFLSGLKNLRLLQLSRWNDVTDYSPLIALENLEYLDLQEMDVKDLSVISQIDSLKFLKLEGTAINNINGINKLKNLEVISMRFLRITGDGETPFIDKVRLQAMENLKYADIDSWAYDDMGIEISGRIEVFENMVEPEDQGVVFPGYEDFWIENLFNVDDLKEYSGRHNQIIDGIYLINHNHMDDNYQALKSEYVDNDEVIKLKVPKHVRNLYIFSQSDETIRIELDGDNNQGLERIVIGSVYVAKDYDGRFGFGNFIIENLDGLAGCTNLKEVVINSAEVNDISGLANLDMLEMVEMKYNNITDISALANKPQLEALDLSGNQINHIDPIMDAIRLETLTLDGNPVVNRELIKYLPLLGEVSF